MGSGEGAQLLAARLMSGGWVSVVPASCYHGKLERGPSPQLVLFSLWPLFLMPVMFSAPHPTLMLGT